LLDNVVIVVVVVVVVVIVVVVVVVVRVVYGCGKLSNSDCFKLSSRHC
jgi:hypothetical protein